MAGAKDSVLTRVRSGLRLYVTNGCATSKATHLAAYSVCRCWCVAPFHHFPSTRNCVPTSALPSRGSVTALLREGIASAEPLRARELLDCAEYELAVEHALRTLQPGELLIVQTEDAGVTRALELVRAARTHHD